jgi:hypothetical protein
MGARDNSYLSITLGGPLRGRTCQSKAPELLSKLAKPQVKALLHIFPHLKLFCTSTLPKHYQKADIPPVYNLPY